LAPSLSCTKEKELNDYPEFTEERHDHDIRGLLASYVVDLPIAVDDIAEVAAMEGWKPAAAAVMFARPQLWATDAARALWAAVAEQVWDNASDQLGGWFEVAAFGSPHWCRATRCVMPSSNWQARPWSRSGWDPR
jgi:hypothetical protein